MLKNILKANKVISQNVVKSKITYVQTYNFSQNEFDREFGNVSSKSLYKYKFYDKGYAMEVGNPIFPLYRQSFEVSKQMYDELNQYSPIFITSILKKQDQDQKLILNQQNPEQKFQEILQEKIKDNDSKNQLNDIANTNNIENITEEQIWEDFKKQKNLLDQYYQMGTYCKADFKELQEGQYKLTLTGLHRVMVKSVYDVRENDLYDDDRFSYGVHIHNDIRIIQDGLSSQFSLFSDIKNEMVKLLNELDDLKVTEQDKQEIEYIKRIFLIYHHFYIKKMSYSQNQIILLTKQSQNLMGLNVKQSFMLKNKIYDEQFYLNAQKELQYNILEVSCEKYDNHEQYLQSLVKQSNKINDLINGEEFPNRFKDKYLRYHSDLLKKLKQETQTIQKKVVKDEKEQTKSIFQCFKLIKDDDKYWKINSENLIKLKSSQDNLQNQNINNDIQKQDNQNQNENEQDINLDIEKKLTMKYINKDKFINQDLIQQIEKNEEEIKKQLQKNSLNSRQERIPFSQNKEEIKTYQEQMEKEKKERKKQEEDLENKIIDNILKQQQILKQRQQIFDENEELDQQQSQTNKENEEQNEIQQETIQQEQIENNNNEQLETNNELKQNQQIKNSNQQQENIVQEEEQVINTNENNQDSEKQQQEQENIQQKEEEEDTVIKASDKRVREIKQFMRSILKSYRRIQGNYMMNEDITNFNIESMITGQEDNVNNQEENEELDTEIEIAKQKLKSQENNIDSQKQDHKINDNQDQKNNDVEITDQEINEQLDTQDTSNDSFYQQESFLVVEQEAVQDCPPFQLDLTIESKLKHLLDTYSKIMHLNSTKVQLNNYNLRDGYRIVDSLGGFLTQANAFDANELQRAFVAIDILSRLEKVQNLMYRYESFLEQFQELGKQARENIFQKKYGQYQLEMFKIAKQNVKGKSRMQAQLAKLEQNLKGKKLPEEVLEIYKREKQRFTEVSEMGQESNIILTYLEWLTSLPFGVRGIDNFDLKRSQKILDQTHYGMDDIKEKIQQFISVGKLKGNLTGKIVLLVGPPGVGKTSLAESIAKSLNKKFARIQCGGESDSAFLKGHRKTYIGAYPGKIVQCLKECGTENCVILIDEIDKIGKGSMHGDPQANLLEILDPEQNMNFTDNYLDFKIDLSQVLFVCSANTTQTISEPLLDRMDVIELSSYTHSEKKAIYKEHLYPKIIKESGVENQKDLFTIPENIIDILIKDYCREPGIRSLEKYSKKLIEKLAFQIVEKDQLKQDKQNTQENQENQNLQEIQVESVDQFQEKIKQEKEKNMEKIEITEENLVKLIGFPKFGEHNLYDNETPVGVTVGLAYTAYGGSLLFLEAIISNRKSKQPGLKATGNLGKVMKESMEIAHTFSRNFAMQYLNSTFLEENQIHLHAPEGAIPKDGPSAGITITTCLMQLVLNKPIKTGIGMTGEISLRGKIMKIGGVKEKILGAQREGFKELIFPKDNEDDVADLKDDITKGMKFHFVSDYKQAFEILFPDVQLQNQ